MALTAKGTPYVVSTDLVANYPTVSSDLATHIDAKLAYNAVTINAQTGSGANAYTFVLADASEGKLVTASNAAAATYTVPPQVSVTWADGAVLRILNQGAGVVTLAGGAGVTLNGAVLTLSQYQYAEIQRTASNTWTVMGVSTAPGLVKITDQTFSAASTVSVNNCFTTTYDAYRIIIDATSTAAVAMRLRWRVGGTDNSTASSYTYQYFLGDGSTTANAQSSQDHTLIADPRDTATLITLDVYAPALARRTNYISNEFSLGTGTDYLGLYGGSHNQAVAYDGFTIYPASGSITGTLRVYGYRN